MAPPLLVIKIVKYCGVWGRGGNGGRQNPTKDYGVPFLCHYKIVKYCGVGGGGGGAKIYTQIMAPPLPVIKIVKYCDVWGGGGNWGAPKSYKDYGVLSLCH